MRISGEHVLQRPVAQVWDALLDPVVLVGTIPGCSRLERLPGAEGEHAYAMTVTAGVASIKGTYDGTCTLGDLVEHESLTMHLQGAGAPGTVDARVAVRFEAVQDDGDGTRISYDADATVGGMVGGVGQRMLTSVSRRMAGEFFGNVATALAGGPAPAAVAPAVAGAAEREQPGTVYTSTGPGPSAAGATNAFWQGVATGAGLVLVGVYAGARWTRRP